MAEFASKGVAGTGLGLGIAGTALGLLNGGNNGNGGGILGGLFGTGNGTACAEKISALEAALARETAERYTDQTVLRSAEKLYDGLKYEDEKIAGVVKQVTDGFLQVGNAVSRLDKEVECIKLLWLKTKRLMLLN